MTPQMIQIALWIPFIFVAAITLPVFCSAGYRRGTWNALASLAATVLAAVASVLLARALAEPVSRPIVAALEEVLASRGGMAVGMGTVLVKGVVCVLMAMGLYFLLMLVLTVLFKYIARALWGEELQRSESGMRWGGLMVRLFDGVLYALLLLLPLYGSLGNVLPMLSSITDLSEADPEAYQALTAVTQHPVAKVSKVGPLKTVYTHLAVVPTENGDISLVEVTESVTGTVERYQMLEEAMLSGEVTMEQIDDLLAFARDELLHQEWVYSGYRQMLDSLPPEAYEDENVTQLIQLMKMDRKDFIKNADTILSVVQYALEEGVVERLDKEPDKAVEILYDSGMMDRLGEMINSSEESVALRDLLIRETVTGLCRKDESAQRRLMASYDSQLHQDKASRLADTEAMLLIAGAIDGDSVLNSYEALLRLGFDQAILEEIFMEYEGESMHHYFWADEEYVEQKRSELAKKYGKELSEKELIWQDILASAQQPLECSRFDRDVPDYHNNAYDRVEFPDF